MKKFLTLVAALCCAVAAMATDYDGLLTVVVNNAGLDTQPSAPPEVSGPFEDFPVEIFREVVEVNLTGTFIVTQAAGAVMRERTKPVVDRFTAEIGATIVTQAQQEIAAVRRNGK